MKLPLRYGVPLLVALLVGLTAVDGQERSVLLVVAMGVALWSALSIPRPPPKEMEDTLEPRLEMDEDEENGEEPPQEENQEAETLPREEVKGSGDPPAKGG